MKCKTAVNMGFEKPGILCFADTFVQDGNSVIRMKLIAKNPRHRNPRTVIVKFKGH